MEKEMIMSEIWIDYQKYVKPTYFGFIHLFHSTSREIEIIRLFCDMIKKNYTSSNKNSKHDHIVITQVPITIQLVLCMFTCP